MQRINSVRRREEQPVLSFRRGSRIAEGEGVQAMERDAWKDAFAKRLAMLRESKGVSARDMSLTLGQSAGYISNIENCVKLSFHVRLLQHLR